MGKSNLVQLYQLWNMMILKMLLNMQLKYHPMVSRCPSFHQVLVMGFWMMHIQKNLAYLIDSFSTTYGKINLNSQCARSPDSVPFTARKSSGLGIMSIADALKEFSVPTVFSYKENGNDERYMTTIMDEVQKESKFMSSL